MQSLKRWMPLMAALGVAACGTDWQPTASPTVGSAEMHAANRLTVLSRNLYIGADLTPVIGTLASPDPADDLPAIVGTVQRLQATDWPRRADALVAELAETRPQVVGVQEVWRLAVNLGPIATLNQDFRQELMSRIAAAGLPYAIAAEVTSINASPNPFVQVSDRDLILVDTLRVRVQAGSQVAGIFAANLGPIAPGVQLLRGWVTVEATVDGVPVTLSSTHLESGASPQIAGLRGLQASQLVATLAGKPSVILLGDFNDVEGSPMYQAVQGAGFRDTWREMRPGVDGFTCCHAELLDNASSAEAFTQRIDYVWTRGLQFRNDRVLGSVHLLGASASDRLDGGLWPSDHAGVLASLLLPPRP